MKTLAILLITVISLSGVAGTTIQSKFFVSTHMLAFASEEDECIEAWLGYFSNNTYSMNFKNTCDDTYRVYYQVVEGDKIIQETTSTIVHAHNSNSTGTLHCGEGAYIQIVKKEIVK